MHIHEIIIDFGFVWTSSIYCLQPPLPNGNMIDNQWKWTNFAQSIQLNQHTDCSASPFAPSNRRPTKRNSLKNKNKAQQVSLLGILWNPSESFGNYIGISRQWQHPKKSSKYSSKCHSNATYEIIELKTHVVDMPKRDHFCFIACSCSYVLRIYWAFCESHPPIFDVLRQIVFSQKITYIFMGEQKTATDSINVHGCLIGYILDAQRIISTIIMDTKVTLTRPILQHRFKWINQLYNTYKQKYICSTVINCNRKPNDCFPDVASTKNEINCFAYFVRPKNEINYASAKIYHSKYEAWKWNIA